MRREDLNLHADGRYHLKVVRLPISPPAHKTQTNPLTHHNCIYKYNTISTLFLTRRQILRKNKSFLQASTKRNYLTSLEQLQPLLKLLRLLLLELFRADVSHNSANSLSSLVAYMVQLRTANFERLRMSILSIGRIEWKDFFYTNTTCHLSNS